MENAIYGVAVFVGASIAITSFVLSSRPIYAVSYRDIATFTVALAVRIEPLYVYLAVIVARPLEIGVTKPCWSTVATD